ncbi:MAG: YqgE/AlgH family protein [bacterium]
MSRVSFKNQLLVSMPQLTNPSFHQTVSLICQHDANGAIGVIVNRLTSHRLGDIFDQLSLPVSDLEHTDQPVFEGGPVNPELGLVIHADESGGGDWESSLEIGGGLWLTSSRDILGAIAGGRGPSSAMMILGYAGWGPGQLEFELRQNSWFNAPADHSIIFDTRIEQKWHQAAELLGIDTARLSTETGHA